jgi:hypothetical protein
MVVIGLILFAAAAAAAIIGIVQNRNLVVDVHALGQTWSVHVYWVLVAGLVIALVGLLGHHERRRRAGPATAPRASGAGTRE